MTSSLLGLASQPDRRRSVREPVLIDAKIISGDLWCIIDCAIIDRSAHGARLRLPWPIRLPSSFDLVVPVENMSVPVRCVWRRGQHAGVEFMGKPGTAPKLTP